MSVYRSKETTKKGNCWYYKVYYQKEKGSKPIPKVSKKYEQEKVIDQN